MREICQCGCFKDCHNPHELDKHGGECSHCKDCTIYTWKDFLFTKKEFVKQGLGENDD